MSRPGDDASDTVESNETMRAPPAEGLPATPDEMPEIAREVYVRIDEFARGGLGRIIRARDSRTGRVVAIKEMLASDEDAAARFVREALVTANLQHPAIVPVYEVGRWPDGQPFYAMKLVRGRPLSDVIAECETVEARLALLPHAIAIADALAYAHGEGVIHRDLKPHNVLVGTFGETVVIDWGLARKLDRRASLPVVPNSFRGETVLGSVMGTPGYMPPEQARGEAVDETADVYAIGAVMFHLLAGRPPYGKGSVDELLERVRAAPAPRLREVVAAIPPDLAALVDRAMAYERGKRYPSAAELAVDLRRFTSGQLVLAHHYTRWQRVRRFARRQRAPLAVGALAVATLATLGTISLRDIVRSRELARSEQRAATSARDEARQRLRASYLDQARAELEEDRADRALPLLAAAAGLGELDPMIRFLAARALEELPDIVRRRGDFAAVELVTGSQDVVMATKAGVERWSPARDVVQWQVPGETWALTSLGDMIAAARTTGVDLLATTDGQLVGNLPAPAGRAHYDVITADLDHHWLVGLSGDGHADIWELATHRLVASVPTPGARNFVFASPDAQHVLIETKGRDAEDVVKLVDRGGREIANLCDPCTALAIRGDEIAVMPQRTKNTRQNVRIVDWNGTLKQSLDPVDASGIGSLELGDKYASLALGGNDDSISLIDRKTGTVQWRVTIADVPEAMKYDDVGRLWVLGAFSGLTAFDVATGMQLAHYPGEPSRVLLSSDDGNTLVTWGETSLVSRSVPVMSRTAIAPTRARVGTAEFASDGTLITASFDGVVARFGKDGRELGHFQASDHSISSLQPLADGAILTASGDDAVLWDGNSYRELLRIHHGHRAQVSPDGHTIVTSGDHGEVALWDRKTGSRVRTLGKLAKAVVRVDWSRDGHAVAAFDDDGAATAWQPETGRELRALPAVADGYGLTFAVSPDARWLVRCGVAPVPVYLYALEPGAHDRLLDDVPAADLYAAVFTNDGKLVALAGKGFVGVWEVATGRRRMFAATDTLSGDVEFAPDGALLYSIGLDRALRVWNIAGDAPVMKIPVPEQAFFVSVSPDGTRAAVATLGAGLLLDTSSFTGDRAALEAAARARSKWQLDASGRLVERGEH